MLWMGCNKWSLEVVKWLHEKRKEGCTTQAMDLAACNGYLEIACYLYDNMNN